MSGLQAEPPSTKSAEEVVYGERVQSWTEAKQVSRRSRADKQNLFDDVLPPVILFVIMLFYVSMMLLTLDSFEGNYSGFLRFAEFRIEQNPFLMERPELSEVLMKRARGYDGQFYFYIAFDPFLQRFKDFPRTYRSVVDNPRYRYGRIGYPLLIRLFSLNQPELYPRTMIWLILASLFVGAFFLMKIALFFQRSALWTLGYILIPGFIASLNVALPEPIASAFLLGGIYFYLREKIPLAVLFFQLSLLIRETGIIFIGVLVLLECFQRKRIKTVILLGCSVLPYLLWKGFMTWRLFPEFGFSTFLYGPKIFGFPFEGILNLYINEWLTHAMDNGLLLFAALITINLLFGIFLTIGSRDVFALSLLAYSIMHICLNHIKVWNGIRNIERTTYEGFLLMLVAFLASKSNCRPLRYALPIFLLALAGYDMFLSSQASSYRAILNLMK